MRRGRRAPVAIAGALAALALLEISRSASGLPLSGSRALVSLLFVAAVLAAGLACRPARDPGGFRIYPRAAAVAAAIGIAGVFTAILFQSEIGAWIAAVAFYSLTLASAHPAGDRGGRTAAFFRISLGAAAAGAVPMAALEIECRFAHEEIFVAAEALLLAAVWLALLAAFRAIASEKPAVRGIRLGPGLLAAAAAAASLGGLTWTIVAYEQSFVDANPPVYPGISAESPFLCGRAPADPETFDAAATFANLLGRVDAKSAKGPAEYAMLALARGDLASASRFRESLLAEVARGRLADQIPTKFWQYEAALRAFYFARVRAAFPGLFPADDEVRVAAWFAGINRSAYSVGVSDLIYAIAYRKVPEGLYENQENGAALLAALETGGLADPGLSASNRLYLDRAPRGWQARFRNSDDAFSYQSEWITNAYLQSLRTGEPPRDRARRSFEWLLLQEPPDGFPLDYNPSAAPRTPATFYLGARLLGDPELLWIAARGIRGFGRLGIPLSAQPGAELPARIDPRSPTIGSCLLYGEAGLPTHVGPLAPDKIVFRDGWADQSGYLLLNLRFAGWHRYRATNTITLLRDRGKTLVSEARGEPFRFLPFERRLFRDKRIPRENLNGLLVEPTGLSAVVSRLAGFGGPWAEDPPGFARVERFDLSDGRDASSSVIADWRGWTQRRSIVFVKSGPIALLDDARGPSHRSAAITWHVSGRAGQDRGRYRLGADGAGGELVLIGLDDGGARMVEHGGGASSLDLTYEPARPGRLRLASVFLRGAWIGANVRALRDRSRVVLQLERAGERAVIPFDFK